MIIRIGAVLMASTLAYVSALASQQSGSVAGPNELQAASEGGEVSPRTPSLQLISQGEALYQRRCGACHSLDHNRIGPKHRSVFGSKAGSVDGFRYSRALQTLDVVWTEETLNAWLTNPTSFAPGTSMGFRLNNPEEREAIIAYLKSLSGETPDG